MTTPKFIIAGDTHIFNYSNASYPASSWTLTFSLVGPSILSVTADADGDDYIITLTSAQTAVLTAGTYTYGYRVRQGDTAYSLHTGVISVRENPASQTPKIQVAERMLQLIESALMGQLSEGEAAESLSIGGRSISLISRAELIEERSFWLAELNRFKKAASGQGALTSIRIVAGRL